MNESTFNDPYNITAVPPWKSPEPEPLAPVNRTLSPRAKAGIGAAAVVLAATGMVTWSHYEADQASAAVSQAQISLQHAKVDLAEQQQQVALAKANSQETAAEAARREAMEKCIAAAGSTYDGVSDCAQAYPAVGSTTDLGDTQSAASATSDGGSHSTVGLLVLGAGGAVAAAGWLKKQFAR